MISQPPGDPPAIKVATWNLWWRFGEWQKRLAAIRQLLEAVRADVIGLQEVWATEQENAAEILADALGMCWTWAPSPYPAHWQRRLPERGPGAGVGNAILSRWPIEEPIAVNLPVGDGGNQGRLCLAANISSPTGRLPFLTTQLDSHPWGSAARVSQVRAVAGMVGAMQRTTYPPVVTGDCNAVAESDEMRLLEGHLTAPAVPGQVLVNAWRYAPPEDRGATWDPRNPHVAATGEPAARIDHVLVGLPRHNGAGRVLGATTFGTSPVAGAWPSDHAGVSVRLAAAPAPGSMPPGRPRG